MQPILTLETTAYTLDQLGTLVAPQIALAGRSNVGKSSLVNALAGRKALARVSVTPGKTRSINFYHIKPGDFYIVDLPGYGYARCSKQEREKWSILLKRYLSGCAHIKALALLLDCRLPPQALDRQLADFARAHELSLLPILTKADKCTQRERALRQGEWQAIVGTVPLLTSAQSKLGIATLWDALYAAAGSTCTVTSAPGTIS